MFDGFMSRLTLVLLAGITLEDVSLSLMQMCHPNIGI